MENYEHITYAENGFYSSGHKVLIFTVFVTSKTDASKDEDDVEGDGPVPQHGRDQGKGETPEDAAEKDEREEFCWRKQKITLVKVSNFTLLLPAFQDRQIRRFFNSIFLMFPKNQLL